MDKETVESGVGEIMSCLGKYTEEEAYWILKQAEIQYLKLTQY